MLASHKVRELLVKKDKSREVATKTAIEIGTTGLGYIVGGPVGALVAAAIKPTLELVTIREWRGLRNIEQIVDSVTKTSGLSQEEFVAWAESEDGRLMLVTNAIQAAYNTMYKQKIAALTKVLAENLHDDARLNISTLIVAALADLEAMHIRLLYSMESQELPSLPKGEDHRPGGAAQSQLEQYFANLSPGILPIVAALERHGLVSEGLAYDRDNRAWSVTTFGRHCLSYLSDKSDS